MIDGYDPFSLSFAIAPKARVGVIIASFSGKLSRMYSWDLDTDQVTKGQFLKGRSKVLDLSANGKYVAYYVEAFHRNAQSWIGLSHPPYYTALAFLPTNHLFQRDAYFTHDGTFIFHTEEQWRYWEGDPPPPTTRIDAGCPFSIKPESHVRRVMKSLKDSRSEEAIDAKRNRVLVARGNSILSRSLPLREESPLLTFEREPFESIKTPTEFRVW